MQKSILLVVTMLCCFLTIAQNKKQQIELLTARYDSLHAVLLTERATTSHSINELTATVNTLTKEVETLTSEIARLNSEKRANQLKINALTEQLSLLNTQIQLKNDTISQLKAPPSLKRKTLTKLIGVHNLQAIAAAAGANTLMDFYIENGKWTADGSSIHQAQREGFDIELIQDDYDKLSSYKLIVQEDLTIVILCKEKPFFSIPYNDKGMVYQLKQTNEHALLPPNFSENTLFNEDKLYLFATDQIDESTTSELTVNEMYIGNAAYLYYDTQEKNFQLFFYNSDPTNFVFK